MLSIKDNVLQEPRPQAGQYLHWELILIVVGLLTFGTAMVYSATTLYEGAAVEEVMRRQLIAILGGGLLALVIYNTQMAYFRKFAMPAFLLAVFFLVLVLIPGVGVRVKGAVRWIQIAGFRFQVSEFMKLAALMGAAWFAVEYRHYMHSFVRGFLPLMATLAIIAALLLKQPDLGASAVIIFEIVGVFFLAGLNGYFFTIVAVLGCLGAGIMVVITPWRAERFLAYLDPWAPEHMADKGWQLTQSLIAIGRGEIGGVGLGMSVEKLRYLPEAHTDFILAIVGEEAGFLGIGFLIFLYYWLVRYIVETGRVAIKLGHVYSGLLTQGIGLWFSIQVLINTCVAMGVLPTKGLTLPFVSYGASATMVSLAAIGIVLRTHRENLTSSRL